MDGLTMDGQAKNNRAPWGPKKDAKLPSMQKVINPKEWSNLLAYRVGARSNQIQKSQCPEKTLIC